MSFPFIQASAGSEWWGRLSEPAFRASKNDCVTKARSESGPHL